MNLIPHKEAVRADSWTVKSFLSFVKMKTHKRLGSRESCQVYWNTLPYAPFLTFPQLLYVYSSQESFHGWLASAYILRIIVLYSFCMHIADYTCTYVLLLSFSHCLLRTRNSSACSASWTRPLRPTVYFSKSYVEIYTACMHLYIYMNSLLLDVTGKAVPHDIHVQENLPLSRTEPNQN